VRPPFGGCRNGPRRAGRLPIWGCAQCHADVVLTSVVLILAGITAWCVASLALALIVGPLVRRADRAEGRSTVLAFEPRPATGAIALPLAR